jgi:hypothetical protein
MIIQGFKGKIIQLPEEKYNRYEVLRKEMQIISKKKLEDINYDDVMKQKEYYRIIKGDI